MATKKTVPVTVGVKIPPREVLHQEGQTYADLIPPKEILVFEIEALVHNVCPSNREVVNELMNAIEEYLENCKLNDLIENPGKPFVEQFTVSLLRREEVKVE